MSFLRRATGWCLSLALTLVFLPLAFAQTNSGQLAGDVVDPSGAVVSGATITATNVATGSVYNAVSTSAGSYRFPSLNIGRYNVTVTAPGFKRTTSTDIEIQVGSTATRTIHLEPGGVTESITVVGDAPTVNTETSDVGGVVTTQQVLELPLSVAGGVGNLRSPEAFVFLMPGTAGPGTANSPNGIFISKLGGGQNFGNEVLIDGASQTRSENGSSFDEEAPSVEAISEFKVTTSTPSAEFGRTTGGIENFVTKAGTNQYHGDIYEIFRNAALDANGWFNNGFKSLCAPGDSTCRSRYQVPKDSKNDFGGTLGGPLLIPHLYNGRDKTFFFFSWEQYKQTQGGAITSTVPTVAERGGNFSDQLIGGPTGQINPCDGTPILYGQIFDPSTQKTVTDAKGNTVRCRSAFLGNTIPSSRFSKTALNILKYYPLPQTSALSNNYADSTPYPIANTTYTVRGDQSIGQKAKLWGTYNTRENTSLKASQTFPGGVDPNQWNQDFTTHFVRVGFDYFFTANVLNHFILGTNRSNSYNFIPSATNGVNYGTLLGIGNLSGKGGFPRINLNAEGIPSLSKNQAGANIDNGIRLNDAVSWEHGRNSFKMGIDYRYQQYSTIDVGGQNGTWNFSGNQTKVTDNPTSDQGTGNGLASFLLGTLDAASLNIRLHQPRWISNYWAGFFQDDFKVSNALTLNLGVRYDVDQPRREAANDTSNFSLTGIDPHSGLPGALVFGTNCHCNTRWADTYFKDFAPRIGFAFAPTSFQGRMVVRGGFSTLYGPLQYNDFGGSTLAGYSANPNFGSDTFNPAFVIDSGFPAYAPPPNLDPGQFDNGNAARANFVGGEYIAKNYGRPAMINQWNIQVQQELAKDLIFTVGYIGSVGQNLRSGLQNINNMPMSNFSRGDQLTGYNLAANGVAKPYAAFNGQVQQALRPFPQYGFIATDCCLQNVGHSSYNALISTLERRFRNGFNLQASYTWSKDITDADSSLPGITGGVNQIQNPFNLHQEKSLSIQDIPQTLVVSYIYELPFGKGRAFLNQNSFVNEIIGGWSVGGIQRYQSGEPISFGCADGIPGWDNCISFTRIPGSSLASHVKNIDPFNQQKILNAGGTVFGPNPAVDSIFNGLRRPDNAPYNNLQPHPALYSQNESFYRQGGAYSFGNVPRVTGEVRNFKYNDEDFSFIKNSPIYESLNFQFKVEMFNAFNRHIFATPNTQPYANNFGVPNSTISNPRSIQLTAKFLF